MLKTPRTLESPPHHSDDYIRFAGLVEFNKSGSEKVIYPCFPKRVFSVPRPLGVKSQRKPLKKRLGACNAWIAFRNHLNSNVALTLQSAVFFPDSLSTFPGMACFLYVLPACFWRPHPNSSNFLPAISWWGSKWDGRTGSPPSPSITEAGLSPGPL